MLRRGLRHERPRHRDPCQLIPHGQRLACIFDEIAFWRDETSATPAAYFDKRTYTLTMTGLSELSDASASIEYFDCY
jgi:hypothetical protein